MMVIFIIIFIASFAVSQTLKYKFNKYSKLGLRANLSGAEIAVKMLRDSGIHDVQVMSVAGKLTDHYNPQSKTVNLSEEVYYGRSAAAAAVSAHECGHAIQHAKAYTFLKFRSAMVPILTVTSQYMTWIILIGIFLMQVSLIPLTVGIVLFSFTTLFAFITLPVEFDASRRALAWINNQGIVSSQEYSMAKDALTWAAMTYVVAALGSLAQLLYLISMVMGRRN